ncbi:thrombospondin type-1 domain-containing protein 4-like isoform X1 [Acipenser ruthenus]|uniref:thrombospondin type-1 domain-containing protein 4-like isoform X1 n=1 Tax=Acipenser ruthenus TaxID=7906 RepID=UPI002741D82B|nr:thrombospondin type-1 domain-containing protein 4-like isoform X1 [Acipenser ruthenus]
MVENFSGILRVSIALSLIGSSLVVSQHSVEHRKVPQRIEAQQHAPDGEGGVSGSWGRWGPWTACSRSCGGGVMEQTRPCLPRYYSEGGGYHHSTPPLPPGRVVSALRPSVPLHREGVRTTRSNDTQHRRTGAARGGRSQEHRPDRRGRGGRRIVPGKYGYGKVPYILPLQTDAGQDPPRDQSRRKRQAPRGYPWRRGQSQGYSQQHPYPGSYSSYHTGPPQHHPNLYQVSLARPQPAGTSLYQHGQDQALQQGLYPGSNPSVHLPAPHRTPSSASFMCVGAYKQYKICNTEACPPNGRNIREVQCASYNNQPFMGRVYEWEPFTEVRGAQRCELNCRALGYRFYVRQAERVIDGTPCDHNETSICVAGQCKSLGCDDYLGSDKVMDKCGVCGGDNTACKVVSGVFKHTLMQVGYHKVVEIPEGATKINITEMIKSRNYLALRTRSGRSIINGNWAIDRPGKYEGVGTMFTYRRPNEISSTAGESFIAEGPTNEIADVYMIYQQPNPGVHYEFILPVENLISSQLPADRRPGDPLNGQLGVSDSSNPNREEYENPHSQGGGDYPGRNPESHVPAAPPPRRQRDYNWKQAGTTECTATCGRGSRFVIFRCVHRVSHEEVSDGLCDSGSKPSAEEEPCNVQACPAFWDIGEWSECSKTCGLGMQHRQVLCRQVYANRTLTVQPNRCQHLEKPETTSTCQLKICSEWQIRTEWSSCAVPCGVGQRSREVRCVSNVGDFVDDEECNMKLRPNDIENCDMGPCAKSWFFTEWGNRCSADCGVGVRSRSVLCMTNHISSLPLEGCGHERPADAMACNNGPCESQVQWFAGSWSQCSAECGSGTQQREVVCLQKSEDSFTVLQPFECASLERPLNQQTCSLKACGAKWYHTDWSSCSKSCEGGFRVREVRCLSDDMTTSEHCEAQLRPDERETCNTEPCAPEIDENCRDKYFNCNVVVQARLCVYNYYKAACCASCTRVANRHPGFLGRR